jgi:hypothetical protein
VLKDDGQLNALIIPYDGSEDFSFGIRPLSRAQSKNTAESFPEFDLYTLG